jgi:hypothetical protein
LVNDFADAVANPIDLRTSKDARDLAASAMRKPGASIFSSNSWPRLRSGPRTRLGPARLCRRDCSPRLDQAQTTTLTAGTRLNLDAVFMRARKA